VIPVRSNVRSSTYPLSVWAVAAVCGAAVVRLALLPAERAGQIANALGVVPSRLAAAPADPQQIATLITSSLLHAGWLHLIINMLYLVVFGPVVESRLGRARFLALFFGAGACGALSHVLANPASATPLVGASGAIAGVLGAHLVLEPHGEIVAAVPVIVFIEIAVLPAGFVIALWFALQVASVLGPTAGAGSPVAWYAHLGGFALGALIALPVAMRERARA